MSSKITLMLSAAIILGAALPATAATKHHHVSHGRREIYNMVPGGAGGACSAVHPPFCDNICTGSGPCAPPDSW